MILHITNLGAIKQMDIDMSKNFTLFCGPNGTGKTYASYVLLAFLTTNTYNHQLLKLDKIVESIRSKGEYTIERSDIEIWLANTCEEVEMQLGSILGIAEDTRNKLFGKFSMRCEYTDDDFIRTQNFQINGTASNGQSMLKITKQKGDVVVKLETDADNCKVYRRRSSIVVHCKRPFKILDFCEYVFCPNVDGRAQQYIYVQNRTVSEQE